MNKRNFGRVIKRIEKHPEMWAQGRSPWASTPDCGFPYCFMGHAEFIRSNGKRIGGVAHPTSSAPLRKWLGLTVSQVEEIYWNTTASIEDFKRWHKQGNVS